jgi:hypothetical protein
MSIKNSIAKNRTTFVLYTILKPSTCSKHEEEIMFLLKAGMQLQLFNSKTNPEGRDKW